ncbi:hypothetical protein [Erythrobacter ramosus]|uniref:Uncharacterized protein n=1 Tax=Erythrobacter ramosus TaxID=35811 RepID=A0A6I4UFS4_9SPHN|nr:hypothetical protein [Erythrobacter ramosus]MXP37298.1 hypothetical protein [Erythrobacter ramosus]
MANTLRAFFGRSSELKKEEGPLSKLSDLRVIAEALAGEGLDLTRFRLDGSEYVAGPLGALTPVCILSARKDGGEYGINYVMNLIVAREAEQTLDSLKAQLLAGGYLWKWNIYDAGFTLSSFTRGRLPTEALTARIRKFLIENARSDNEAETFARSGDTKFLADCRRLKPEEVEARLLAPLKQRRRMLEGET